MPSSLGSASTTYPSIPLNSEFSAPSDPSLRAVYDRLATARPESLQGAAAQSVGFKAVSAADAAYTSGDREQAEFYKQVAGSMAEIAMGFIPVVGEGQALYELFVGKSLITGERLSVEMRAMAALGVVSLGVAPSIAKLGKWGLSIAGQSLVSARVMARANRLYASLEGTRWGRLILNDTGALGDLASVNKRLTHAQRSDMMRVANIVKKHGTISDFKGVLRETRGVELYSGNGKLWNHSLEMQNSVRGLTKALQGMEGSLKNPRLDNAVRVLLEEHADSARKNLAYMVRALNGNR